MNDLTGAKVLIGNAVKDIYFTNEMQFEKLSNYSNIQNKQLINLNICGFKRVTIVVHNIIPKTGKLFTIILLPLRSVNV
jgi:hypothetical protein